MAWGETDRGDDVLLLAGGADVELEEGQQVLRAADGRAALRRRQRRRRGARRQRRAAAGQRLGLRHTRV